ncbi:hypothetical protein [Streptomyces sp. RerS4]|uniref:hypothetical protein n=1 Tax=Streptomyces sp. RerS4 TaxID=2942449 RepID=UPI00201C3C8B|nr:hypothetical protein [Streptomyces sp. RerS4]UQW99133.1 hypothetical protein M4D82_00190 [Streptomyces sp. RerS4]
MTDQRVTIEAEAFPLMVRLGPQLLLMQPVSRTAVHGLDEAYTEAAFDLTTDIQSTGTSIDARWQVLPDHTHVLLVLHGRAPKPFELAIRYTLSSPTERQAFLDIAQHADTGPVALFIYPDRHDVAQAATALQKPDLPLFTSLGIGVEEALHCRTLHRLGRHPRKPA